MLVFEELVFAITPDELFIGYVGSEMSMVSLLLVEQVLFSNKSVLFDNYGDYGREEVVLSSSV